MVDLDSLLPGDVVVRCCGTYQLKFVEKWNGDCYMFNVVGEEYTGADFLSKLDAPNYSLKGGNSGE